LVLSGALTTAGLTGCDDGSPPPPAVSSDNTYTNNQYVSGAGYYHAPYHSWYPYRYNSYVPDRGFYYGGGWHPWADNSTISSSKPTPEAAHLANSKATSSGRSSGSTSRGGFGHSWGSSSS